MLQELCERAKAEMKAMPTEELGSWQNAVTMANGCWLTRGHFSQNFYIYCKELPEEHHCSWNGHFCMHGSDDVVE